MYAFCKNNNIEEADFYSFYGSIEALKEDIWIKFYENTATNLLKDENFATYSNSNKLLSLYFTMFEVLTLNRSYVLYALKDTKNGLKTLQQLKGLRSNFKEFITKIVDEHEEPKNETIQRVTKPLYAEGAWIQFLFLLK
ncbi:MAG TPA: heat-shock protein, partial [Flavobacterium sp.]|nr:heat-shock protein [Flavobacterium sp.]